MSDVQALLTKCRDLGATFSPTPEGKLKVKAPTPLPDGLRQELKERKAEILATLQSPSWLCPHCGHPSTIEEICKSLDGKRWLTMWMCVYCEISAVTPDAIREPPVWMPRTEQ